MSKEEDKIELKNSFNKFGKATEEEESHKSFI